MPENQSKASFTNRSSMWRARSRVIFWGASENSKTCVRICCPSYLWAVRSHSWRTHQLGPFGERHVWKNCQTPQKAIEVERIEDCRINPNEDCDGRFHKSKHWRIQTNMPWLQKISHCQNQGRQFDGWEEKAFGTKNGTGKLNSVATNSNPCKSKSMNSKNNVKEDKKPWTVYPFGEIRRKTNHSAENLSFGANAANRPSTPGTKDRQDIVPNNDRLHQTTQKIVSSPLPSL